MTAKRFTELMADVSLSLTENEIKEGWHFCGEFDGLLVKGNPMRDTCGQSCVDSLNEDRQDIDQ